jgi:hypothetical protein
VKAAVELALVAAAVAGLAVAAWHLAPRAVACAAHDAALIDARQAHCQGAGPCW